jgi:hypothetical protein
VWYNQALNHKDIMQPSNHHNPRVTHSSNYTKDIVQMSKHRNPRVTHSRNYTKDIRQPSKRHNPRVTLLSNYTKDIMQPSNHGNPGLTQLAPQSRQELHMRCRTWCVSDDRRVKKTKLGGWFLNDRLNLFLPKKDLNTVKHN